MYSVQGRTFVSLVMVFHRALSIFSQPFESSAASAITYQTTSLTFTFIKYEYLYLIISGGLGLILVWLCVISKCFSEEAGYSKINISELGLNGIFPDNRGNDLLDSFGLGSIGVLGGSFFVGIIGVPRIIMISMVFLAPFVVLGFKAFLQFIPRIEGEMVMKAISILLAIIILFNSGFVATVINDDRSPQPNLNREYILENGSEKQQFYLYARYVPTEDIKGTKWIIRYRDKENTIFGPGHHMMFPSHLYVTDHDLRSPPGDYQELNRDTFSNDGYVFLNQMSTRWGKVIPTLRPRSYSYEYFNDTSNNESFILLEEFPLQQENKIYSNGGSRVYI
jgi:uncharacterized membrane protein